MKASENTCIRIPGDLDEKSASAIHRILNAAAGGDYGPLVKRERLVGASIGFTLNTGCHHDLCLAFEMSTQQKVALSVRGVEFLPASSACLMNPIR